MRSLLLCCLSLALAGCALTPPPARVSPLAPGQWQASLPHGGKLPQLSQWWQQFNDQVLTELIDAGQAASATVAAAQARIAQARLTQTSADAALLPTLSATASGTRARSVPTGAIPTTLSAGLQTAWEIDVFGRERSAATAAEQRVSGVQALWHDARVSVAADVATRYFSLTSCGQQTVVAERDAASRAETARLSDLTATAGFTAPATAALARASASEAAARLSQQRANCAVQTKALVALTALPEAEIQQKIAKSVLNSPDAQVSTAYTALFLIASPITRTVASLPADTLSQRPDVFNAEREVAAASQDVGSAQAQRYPRLTLSGSLGRQENRTNGRNRLFNAWSIGPVNLTLPIFDGGVNVANIDAAVATYNQAVLQYRSVVRRAVQEVEEALVNLDSTAARQGDSGSAASNYRRSFVATQARYQSGLASLVELEDARRSLLSAETALVTLHNERRAAWVALYRAAGGGWTLQTNANTPDDTAAPTAAASPDANSDAAPAASSTSAAKP